MHPSARVEAGRRYGLASTVWDGVTADEMDAFASPSFGAAALSFAWVVAALPQGGFSFGASRAGVGTALETAAKGGGAALCLIVAGLACRAAALDAAIDAQDVGFAAGLLPIIGSWRYVLADTTSGGGE